MAMRKPFMGSGAASPAAAAGSEPIPGMAMPPQPGRTGMQPPMPMGGNNQPMQGGPQGTMPVNAGMPGMPPMDTHAGGPTSPMNISGMLQARMGDRSAAPAMGSQQPQSQNGMPGPSMQPWGSESGTDALSMGSAQGPKRVPFGGAPSGEPANANPDPTQQGDPATVMMKILRTMGRI